MSRPRLSYANVMATIAVFIALGGGAYAATQLKKNSVGTKQIKNGAVTPEKLSGSAKGSLPGAKGPEGPPGAKGDTGAAGSALAYARVYDDGEMDPAHSKNVEGVVLACEPNEPKECTKPQTEPELGPHPEFCFKLSFEPNVVSATPIEGFTYNHTTPLVDAEIPGRPYGELRGGCPPGYQSADVRLSKEGSFEPEYGVYVVFN